MRLRMWHRAAASTVAIMFTAATAIAFGPATPALASETGYEWMYTGPSPSREFVEWNINNRYNNVQVNQTGSLAWNHCLTTWFDWNMNSIWPTSEHFDARAIRNCQSGFGGTVSMTNYDPAPSWNWWYVGQQKLAGCYGPNDTTSGCVNGPQAAIPLGSVNAAFNGGNWVTRWYARWSNGTTAYHSGGDPRSSTS